MTNPSLDATYFDRLYAANPDPWCLETSAYEHAKYAATVAALPQSRYRRGVEIGCSIGVLTAQIATKCETLLGIDVAEAALIKARERCSALDNVEFQRLALPDERPEGQFDLIVLSEVLYFFHPTTISAVADAVMEMALPSADILLVHWLGPTPDYPMSGDTAVAAFLNAVESKARLVNQQRQTEYRLDLLHC